MKLEQLFKPMYALVEDDASNIENKTLDKTPAPSKDDEWSTAQVAVKLGVTQSRVRQLVMDGRLKSKTPAKGQRDHRFDPEVVKKFSKKKREITGRPEGSKND